MKALLWGRMSQIQVQITCIIVILQQLLCSLPSTWRGTLFWTQDQLYRQKKNWWFLVARSVFLVLLHRFASLPCTFGSSPCCDCSAISAWSHTLYKLWGFAFWRNFLPSPTSLVFFPSIPLSLARSPSSFPSSKIEFWHAKKATHGRTTAPNALALALFSCSLPFPPLSVPLEWVHAHRFSWSPVLQCSNLRCKRRVNRW